MQIVVAICVAITFIIYYQVRGSVRRRKQIQNLRFLDALQAVTDAYSRGDYETALKRAEGLKEGRSKTAPYYFYRGSMFCKLGQLAEAEANLREALSLKQDTRSAALTNEALGITLMEQERYADAIACFENSIRICPQRGCSHRAIAETWLRQGCSIGEALTRSRQAADIDRTTEALSAEIHNLNLGEALATVAWAVTTDSADAAEVERLLAAAFRLCGDEYKPILAQLHYHAGRAYAALGMAEKSRGHFGQAVAIDPQGNFGRLSRALTPSPVAG